VLKRNIKWRLINLLENSMKRTTVTLPKDLVDDLLEVLPAKNKTQAVTLAVQESIKRRKVEYLKTLAGQGRAAKTSGS
jgi:metal-responsive CopG/Arc/MetJ family transcriptional regulator